MAAGLRVHPSIEAALRRGTPVVALESAVVTHGLPRAPLGRRPTGADDEWDVAGPTNLELARLLGREVRRRGAVPATCAVLDGELRVGLDDEELCRLAEDGDATKAAARDLASCLAAGASAGLTVSATLEACRLTAVPPPGGAGGTRAGIRVFATGGIGGAHRGWSSSGDISADLVQIARTDVCVVCAGPKAILDVAATTELLDSLGVPVIGHCTDCMPRFVCPPDPRLPLPTRLDDPKAIARLCVLRWQLLGQRGGVLVVQAAPPGQAIEVGHFEALLKRSEESALAHGVRGAAVTPFLLAELARLSGGRSLDANVALLVRNAGLASAIAVAMSAGPAPTA